MFILVGLFLPLSSVSAGTVLSSSKYAWSNNAGYINFENVTVSDNALSGYAWSTNYGWIKFNPAQGGVMNDGTGNLAGSAWGANLGWIDFNGVSINGTTGEFSGTAIGSLSGTITFDCIHCDVRTDWRQATPPPVSSGGGGGGGGGNTPVPPQIDVNDVPLIVLPEPSDTIIQDTSVGKIIMEVPQKSVIKKTTFTLIEEPLSHFNEYLTIDGKKLVNSVFFNIIAKDPDGNEIQYFLNPITVTLPIPIDPGGAKNLAVYWLNETNWQWVLIPEAVFTDEKVTFMLDHLTKFAIFMTTDKRALEGPINLLSSLPLPVEKKPIRENEVVNQPISEKKGTIPGTIKESVQSVQDMNWKLVFPVIISLFFILFIFFKKRRKRNHF